MSKDSRIEKDLRDALKSKKVYKDVPDVWDGQKVPACFGKMELHIRKNISDRSEIKQTVEGLTKCPVCNFLESCFFLSNIDDSQQILMFQRFLHTESKRHTKLLENILSRLK